MHKQLSLLQLVSPALPVGAYSYSEGLEYLVEQNVISSRESLQNWLEFELSYGAIRLETAIMNRSYYCFLNRDLAGLETWNNWLSAARETAELRQQSWQMGQALLKLLLELSPELKLINLDFLSPCNYAIAFGITAATWEIDPSEATLGYLHSWVANLVSAGVRLIPLGQTAGQQILFRLQDVIITTAEETINLKDDQLSSCTWGLSLASMNHEIQYTRLFRS